VIREQPWRFATQTWIVCTRESFRHKAGWYIEDLGSINGTRLNDSPVHRSPIADGDVIQLGPAVFLTFAMVFRAQEVELRRNVRKPREPTLFPAPCWRGTTTINCPQPLNPQLRPANRSACCAFKLDGYGRLLEHRGQEAANALLRHLVATNPTAPRYRGDYRETGRGRIRRPLARRRPCGRIARGQAPSHCSRDRPPDGSGEP